MKKWLCIILLVLIPIAVIAGDNYIRLLNAVEATGASIPVSVVGNPNHTVQVFFTNVSTVNGKDVDALTVALEGSLINSSSKFSSLSSVNQHGTHVFTAGELTAKKAMFHVNNAPVNYIRANIKTLTEQGDTDVTVLYLEGKQ